jgi:Flp pilus assembly protein TadG
MKTRTAHLTTHSSNASGRRGAALVEFAIVAPLLLALVFGIIESGLLIKDDLAIQHAAREGARSAAMGDTTSAIIQRIEDSSPAARLTASNITLEKSTLSSGGWAALGDSGSQNDAVSGGCVRVTVTLGHQWLTGLFSSSATQLTAAVVQRRD